MRRLLNTISIFKPLDGISLNNKTVTDVHEEEKYILITWIIVVKAPCLDVVLSELGVGQQLDSVGHQLHCFQSKCLELEVDFTNLNFSSDMHTSA